MRGVSMILLLLASCVVVRCEESPFGYLAVSPKTLFAGKEESICITITGTEEPVEVTLAFMENNVTEISRSPSFSVEFDTACTSVEVPSFDEYPKTVILSVQMKRLSAAETELTDDKKVVIFKTGKETYVQTDKPIYKPGQPVMFRVLTLDKEFKPDPTAVADIWVETPSKIRVAQWLDQSSEDGLLDMEVPMSSDPPLGEWKIVVVRDDERIERTFKVDEYVLPKFEIAITPPSFIVTDAKEFEIRICAKYTYGQPVRGSFSADVSIDQEYYYWGAKEERPVLRFESADTGSSGCGTIVVNGADIHLNSSDYSVWSSQLKVDANFTEEATGVTLSENFVSKSGIVTTDPLFLDLKGPSTFKPGMPFSVLLTVTYPDGKPAPGKEIQVTSRADSETIFNQTFTSSDSGVVNVVLENVDIETSEINVFAEAPGYKNWKAYDPEDEDQYRYHYIYDPIASLYAEASYSPSGSFVQILPINGQLVPGTEQEFIIQFTADPAVMDDLHWFFVFMSRNEILAVPVSTVKDGPSRKKRTSEPYFPIVGPPGPNEDKVNITQPGQLFSKMHKFTVTQKMSPFTKMLVYYILPDQEVVAHSAEFEVKPVFENEVSIAFANNEEAPGGKAILKLSASEGSLCAVNVVDKSVYVLQEEEDQMTKAKVFDKIKEDELHYTNYWTPIESDHCPNEYPWWWYGAIDKKRRRKRTSVPYFGGSSVYEDSSKAFKDMGLVFISNLKVETRPCNTGRYPVAVAYNEAGPVLDEVAGGPGLAPSVRSFFPETWLWDLIRIGDNGEAVKDLDVPHTITDWVGNGYCLSKDTGLGVADTSTLRAFQPFFVSLTLPYSIIRGEEVTIKATVFNYLSDECVVVRVSLIESDEFEIVDSVPSQKGCVCAQAAETFDFPVMGNTLGEIDIEVHVVSVADEEFLCGNEVTLNDQTGLSDAVRRKLLVEPEGIQHEYSINEYFCPNKLQFRAFNKKFNLGTPPNTVEGSMRGRVTLTGDMMGQTLSNLDSLLRIPTGCGEQNMLGFVPNIVVMKYFTESGQLTDDIKLKAESNMKKGYMRELNYRHKDGSYSAFGESDESGSTWLTAYVLKSYGQASTFISIDQEDLDITIDWLKSMQNPQGCFLAVGNLCHKAMAGGVNNEITLTAYIVTALLDAGMEPEDPVIQGALECLESEAESLSDVYAAAQLAYAMVRAGHPDASNVMDFLESVAVNEGNTKHWVSNRDDASEFDTYYRDSKMAQNIETTAYVLLALTEYLSPEEARLAGSPLSRWLVGQRSSNGGFKSTQDTVVGLQALAAYAGTLSKEPIKMRVELMERGRKVRQFELLEKNKLVVQESDLNVPTTYTIRARGSGCGLLQFTVYYNLQPLTPPVAPFALTKKSKNLDEKCDRFLTNLCASYTGPGGSNMVLAQVKLTTGFTPDAESINQLKAQALDSKLKRVDTDGKLISFYLDQGLDTTPVCWDFIATKEFDVKNAKPGTLNMYDYYEKDLAISDSLEFVCEEPAVVPSAQPDMPPVEPEVAIDPTIKPDVPPVEPEVDPTAKPDVPPVEPEVDPTIQPEVPPVEPEVDPTVKPDKPPVEPEVDPSFKTDKPPVKPEVDPSDKPDKPPVEPEIDPSAKPDKPPVEPEVDPSAKPDKPPVEPEVDPSAKPDKPPVEPEVDPSAKPDKPPVEPEVDPSAKPDKPPVEPEVDPSAKPDKPPVEPEVDPSAKPDKPPVEPEVDPSAKPDKPPFEPEVDPSAKPDMPPVEPEVDTSAKPDKPPVEPEVDPSAKPDKPPVEPEVDPTAKPDKPPVEPEVDPTAKPDKPPVEPEVDPSAKPDKPPVEPEVDPTAKPDKPPVEPEVDPSAKPDKPPVEPEVDPSAKPVVEPEVDPSAKPDVPPVEPEIDPTIKPEVSPVEPEIDPTIKPEVPPVEPEVQVDPTIKPEVLPVEPEVDPTIKPDVPPVEPEVDPTIKPEVPPVEPEVDPTVKPEVPPVEPEVDPTIKPEVPPVEPEVDPTIKPDVPPVEPEVDPTIKPDVPPVEPEVDPTIKPDVPPVEPEVDPTIKPEVPPVEPEVEPTVKPEVPPVEPEVDPTIKPEVLPVEPEVQVDPTIKPEVLPVEPEVEPTVKPDVPPVEPEVDPTIKPEVPPVEPEVEPTIKPEVLPVEPEVDPTIKPEVLPVEPEVEPTVKPDVPPVEPEVDPTIKPEVPPVEPEVEPTVKPEVPPVEPEVDPTIKPEVLPVEPEVQVDPTIKPEVLPVEPEVEPTVKPDVPPVEPEVDPTIKPEVPPVEPEVEPTIKPEVPPVEPEVDPTIKPDVPPVEPEVEPTAKPDVPSVSPTVLPTTVPTTTTEPMVVADPFCLIYPSICGNGICIDDESQPSFHRCLCDNGFVDEKGMCVAVTTLPPTTTVTQKLMNVTEIILDTYCTLFPDVCGDGTCVDDNTQSLSYRCDCDSGYEFMEGTCKDVDECLTENVCLSPNKVCSNLPGTYDCNCLDTYQEDSEGNCFACPVCSDDLPDGFEEYFCASDYVFGVKVRPDGMLRILLELSQTGNRIRDTRYIDPLMDSRCTCDEITYGDRVIIMTSMDKVSIEQLRQKTVETVDLAGAYIVPLKTRIKQQLDNVRTLNCV